MKKNTVFLLLLLIFALSSSAIANGSYVDNGDGTVTDLRTGLMWQQGDSGVVYTWEEALAYSADLVHAEYSDWRLPNIRELETLVDESDYDPAIDSGYFMDTRNYGYWSSSTYAGNNAGGWRVEFSDGRIGNYAKSNEFYVRCVRSGDSKPSLPLQVSLFADPVSGTAPFLSTLSCTVAYGTPPYTYSWDFGDGKSGGNKAEVSHIYSSAGTFLAVVTVEDDMGKSVSQSVEITGESAPLTPFSTDRYSFFASPGEVIPMTAHGGNGTYLWLVVDSLSGGYFDQNGDSVSLVEGPNVLYHVPPEPGIYVVSLSNGTESKQITIDSRTPKSLTISPDTLILTTRSTAATPLVTATYEDGTTGVPGSVTWSSEDSNIAVVNELGHVTPLGNGTTRIMAHFQGVSGYYTVTVDTTLISLVLNPSLLFLNFDETVTVEAVATWRDSSSAIIPDLTLSAEEPIVAISGMSLTGLADGTTTISATYQGMTAEGIVQVSVPSPMGLSPPSLRMAKNENGVVSISGGVPPFTVDEGILSGPVGRTWSVTASDRVGMHDFVVTDSAGAARTLSVTVFEDFTITASKTDVVRGESVTITPNGGKAPYRWLTTTGELSVMESYDTSPVTYVVPLQEGVFTVSAVDANGTDTSVLITTFQELIVSPTNIYVEVNGEDRVQVLGGTPPYQAVVMSGSVTRLSEGEFLYRAPSAFGESQMTVLDNQGEQRTVSVHVIKPISVTPLQAYMRPGEVREFQVTGGINGDEGVHVVAFAGNAPLHPENAVIRYTAPSVTGADYLLVTDRSGHQEKIDIDVSSEDFFVSPSNVVRYRGEETVFNAVNGAKGAVTWSAEQGDIETGEEVWSMTYKAPEIAGEYRITAADNSGKIARAVVHVVNEKVRITPRQVYAAPGDPVTFRVFGGAGGYEVKIIDGILSSRVEEEFFEYIAPHIGGEYFITVLDRSGAWTQASVQVSGNSEFEPVFPGGVVYDLVNQIKGAAESLVTENEERYGLAVTLNYHPPDPIPMRLYLRWKLPDGSYMYVQQWDGTTDFKAWGLNLVENPVDFIGQFPLSAHMFENFRLYGDLFSEISEAELMALNGKGTYRFEFILKPAGSLSRDEYTIPAHLTVGP